MTKAGTDGAAALDGATTAADGTTDALNAAGTAAGGAGAAGKAAAEAAATGWSAVTAALADYASRARDIGADVGQTLVGAFSGLVGRRQTGAIGARKLRFIKVDCVKPRQMAE